MEKYNITGMSCAACSASVERAAKKVSGVEKCSVSLLTNSMTVEGEYDSNELIKAINNAGYGASKFGEGENTASQKQTETVDKETKIIKIRLAVSLVFLVILMYFAMGHNMFSLPLSAYFESNPISVAIVQLLLSTIVLIINQKFFINGAKSLVRLNPNMDALVALGSSVSFLYSIGILFIMVSHPEKAAHLLHELYFESAAMILVLITVGKMLESYSKGKTTNALKDLIKLAPKTATVIKNGVEKVVAVEEVRVDDIFIIRPGESVAVDGIIIDGITSIDESALTGESTPVDKDIGDYVSAGTINLTGFVTCKASRVGQDTTLSRIIKTVSDALSTKAPIARIADKVSGIFVPAVISIAIITVIIWLILGQDFGFALVRGISVLVISCPCALGLATPVAIVVGNGVGAKNGILFKNAESIETAGRVKTVVLDKTGTITKGMPVITDIIPIGEISQKQLIEYAYSLEKKSEHPLAKAIVEYALQNGINYFETENFRILSGSGLYAEIDGKKLLGGNRKFIETVTDIDDESARCAENLAQEGKTPLFFALDDKLIGIIAVADEIKNDSVKAISLLKEMGINTVMLTGDNERTANSIGKTVGVDKIISGVLPEGKEKVIRELQENQKVAMVGDGINDAIALTVSDVGIAIGAGTDIAIDSSDIVLMKSTLMDVVSAIKISRATLRNIHQNLFWAFIYNALGIPLAAGAFIFIFGWKLTPMFGALAMSLSSFCVVTNALRLNLIKIDGSSNKICLNEQYTTLYVKGMMCEHCERRVQELLLQIDGIKSAKADYKNKTVKIIIDGNIDFDTIKKAIEPDGYKLKNKKG